MCSRPLRPFGLPIYVARVPAAPFTRSYPCSFYVDHSHYLVLAPATLAALQSTRAIEARLLPSSLAAIHRGFAFYVAFPKTLHSLTRDVFHVADPISSIASRPHCKHLPEMIPGFETRSSPNLLVATLATLPSISLVP